MGQTTTQQRDVCNMHVPSSDTAAVRAHRARAGLILIAAVILTAFTAAAPSSVSQADIAGFLATERQFLDAEHPNDTYWGARATDKQLTDIGLTACAFWRRSLTDVQVLTSMMGGASMLPPAGSEARALGLQRVNNARRFLCPSG